MLRVMRLIGLLISLTLPVICYSHMSSRKHGKGVQTPTPLRMMEDPTLWHVMPSRTQKKNVTSKMEPPPSKKKKVVLDEDTYVEAIGKVIERDYFPDLDKYRSYLEVGFQNWLLLCSIYKQLKKRTLTELKD